VTASFLESRVVQQLAASQIVLERLGLVLHLEQAGNSWLVSLVDLATRRVAASSEVEALPADRDAAVSAIAQVVAQLAAQVVDHTDPAPRVRPPALPGPTDAQISRARRALAELKFNRRSIRFEPSDRDERSGSTARLPDWVFLRGELDQPLDPPAFYRLVSRDDLAWAYGRRRGLKIGGFVLASTSLVVAGVLFGGNDTPFCDYELTPDGHGRCLRTHHPSLIGAAGAMLGIGVTSALIGFYFAARSQPISEDDARALADAYNQRLRRRIGLPVAPRHALLRDVTLTPYVAGRDAGAVLGARF
jgi:hypothetical protein